MDWIDIGLHAGISIFAMGLFWLFKFPATGAIISTGFWPGRELSQHWPDWVEILTHPQSLLEWVVPVGLSWFVLGWIANYESAEEIPRW